MRWVRQLLARFRRWRRPLSLGARGEREAERFLKRLGYTIVGRGERDKVGEIDLIAVDERVLVFVEVKTRATAIAGQPSEAVDRDKQRRLTRLAKIYMRRHDLHECAARFDVVSILWPNAKSKPAIEHIKHAFEACD